MGMNHYHANVNVILTGVATIVMFAISPHKIVELMVGLIQLLVNVIIVMFNVHLDKLPPLMVHVLVLMFVISIISLVILIKSNNLIQYVAVLIAHYVKIMGELMRAQTYVNVIVKILLVQLIIKLTRILVVVFRINVILLVTQVISLLKTVVIVFHVISLNVNQVKFVCPMRLQAVSVHVSAAN
jgi:hypothetical protein